jgi:hypothetical protein
MTRQTMLTDLGVREVTEQELDHVAGAGAKEGWTAVAAIVAVAMLYPVMTTTAIAALTGAAIGTAMTQ